MNAGEELQHLKIISGPLAKKVVVGKEREVYLSFQVLIKVDS